MGQGFISIGWDPIGDLRDLKDDPVGLKTQIAAAYPAAKPGAIPVWAGVLNRFAFGMSQGDFVISPNKADSTLNFGRVSGGYYWTADAKTHRHRRPHRFEEFTAGLLRAMGYRATATPPSGDGGVDVIAHRDSLGLEPPIIKVQCKKTLSTIGGPDVQKLSGALAHGGAEVALFVTLGAYSSDAIRIERTRQDLRLINGTQLVDLVLEYYEVLDPEWKQLLPLRRVYVVDREPEG